jgi:hypothetical protein
MIISDLQYIESATEAEVEGGSTYYKSSVYIKPVYHKPIYYNPAYNLAVAEAGGQAYGKNTKTYTSTNALVIEGNYSGSGSKSVSESY